LEGRGMLIVDCQSLCYVVNILILFPDDENTNFGFLAEGLPPLKGEGRGEVIYNKLYK
jgi:hypothetical protein